jgi:hypothetical protein
MASSSRAVGLFGPFFDLSGRSHAEIKDRSSQPLLPPVQEEPSSEDDEVMAPPPTQQETTFDAPPPTETLNQPLFTQDDARHILVGAVLYKKLSPRDICNLILPFAAVGYGDITHTDGIWKKFGGKTKTKAGKCIPAMADFMERLKQLPQSFQDMVLDAECTLADAKICLESLAQLSNKRTIDHEAHHEILKQKFPGYQAFFNKAGHQSLFYNLLPHNMFFHPNPYSQEAQEDNHVSRRLYLIFHRGWITPKQADSMNPEILRNLLKSIPGLHAVGKGVLTIAQINDMPTPEHAAVLFEERTLMLLRNKVLTCDEIAQIQMRSQAELEQEALLDQETARLALLAHPPSRLSQCFSTFSCFFPKQTQQPPASPNAYRDFQKRIQQLLQEKEMQMRQQQPTQKRWFTCC